MMLALSILLLMSQDLSKDPFCSIRISPAEYRDRRVDAPGLLVSSQHNAVLTSMRLKGEDRQLCSSEVLTAALPAELRKGIVIPEDTKRDQELGIAFASLVRSPNRVERSGCFQVKGVVKVARHFDVIERTGFGYRGQQQTAIVVESLTPIPCLGAASPLKK